MIREIKCNKKPNERLNASSFLWAHSWLMRKMFISSNYCFSRKGCLPTCRTARIIIILWKSIFILFFLFLQVLAPGWPLKEIFIRGFFLLCKFSGVVFPYFFLFYLLRVSRLAFYDYHRERLHTKSCVI